MSGVGGRVGHLGAFGEIFIAEPGGFEGVTSTLRYKTVYGTMYDTWLRKNKEKETKRER